MPLYDYDCSRCGPFEGLARIADRDRHAACPACGRDAPRAAVGGAPRIGAADTGLHRLIDAQHRAAERGGHVRLRHPMACGCCRR